ncbi:hypothetical protein WAF17_21135 [Bernardetia sp. ABR2-2B]|uniref:hypothetical protein n=1 Tax=Bernardetia sp. ABR2-2B TaxID=3127472 RepID=UPI0030D5484D
MATFSYSLTDTKIETGTVTRTRDITELYECVSITPCTSCPPCIRYKMPFLDSDIFTIAVDFKIVNVRLKRIDNSLIQLQNSWASNNILTITFADIPSNERCFYIELERKDGSFCCFEFAYERVGVDCHDSTILISSYYDTSDCLGNNYTGSYSNQIRIYALLEHVANESETVKSDDKIISEEIRDVYQLSFNRQGFGLIPGTWLHAHFTKSVMRGAVVLTETVDKHFEFEKFEGNIEASQNVISDWYPVLRLKTLACEQDFICT